jgi:hypothetical protein
MIEGTGEAGLPYVLTDIHLIAAVVARVVLGRYAAYIK